MGAEPYLESFEKFDGYLQARSRLSEPFKCVSS